MAHTSSDNCGTVCHFTSRKCLILFRQCRSLLNLVLQHSHLIVQQYSTLHSHILIRLLTANFGTDSSSNRRAERSPLWKAVSISSPIPNGTFCGGCSLYEQRRDKQYTRGMSELLCITSLEFRPTTPALDPYTLVLLPQSTVTLLDFSQPHSKKASFLYF